MILKSESPRTHNLYLHPEGNAVFTTTAGTAIMTYGGGGFGGELAGIGGGLASEDLVISAGATALILDKGFDILTKPAYDVIPETLLPEDLMKWNDKLQDREGVYIEESKHKYNLEDDGLEDENPTKTRIGKQKGKTPRNNKVQNKQVRDIANKLGLNDDQRRQLHNRISKKGLGYHDILEEADDLYRPKGE